MRPVEKGMTLIEVLVAMAIVAVALVALIRIQSQAVEIRPRLEQQYMAALLAENILIEYELAPPTFGSDKLSGTRQMGRYDFSWRASLSSTSESSLIRIDLDVYLQNTDSSERIDHDNTASFRLTGFLRHEG